MISDHGAEAAHARQDAYRECPRPSVLFTADGCVCPYCLRAVEDDGCTCDGPAVIVTSFIQESCTERRQVRL